MLENKKIELQSKKDSLDKKIRERKTIEFERRED